VVSTPELDDIDEIWSIHERILAVEAAQVHESWYAEYGDTYHPRTADLIRMGQSLTQSDLQEALTNRERLRQRLTAALHRIDCQLWLSPAATGPAPKGLESTGNPIMNLPWTHAGVPTISLPSGVADGGLPLGLQLTGTANADEMLFEWASAIEAALPPPPRALDS
jgi:Asp-tRNA(Asn)/Glu-tRNA(Gln) amidotransferase A subunit family amidase